MMLGLSLFSHRFTSSFIFDDFSINVETPALLTPF